MDMSSARNFVTIDIVRRANENLMRKGVEGASKGFYSTFLNKWIRPRYFTEKELNAAWGRVLERRSNSKI